MNVVGVLRYDTLAATALSTGVVDLRVATRVEQPVEVGGVAVDQRGEVALLCLDPAARLLRRGAADPDAVEYNMVTAPSCYVIVDWRAVLLRPELPKIPSRIAEFNLKIVANRLKCQSKSYHRAVAAARVGEGLDHPYCDRREEHVVGGHEHALPDHISSRGPAGDQAERRDQHGEKRRGAEADDERVAHLGLVRLERRPNLARGAEK